MIKLTRISDERIPYKPDDQNDEICGDIGEFKRILFLEGAQAQLEADQEKVKAIVQEIIKLAIESDVLCPKEDAIKNNCIVCKFFWQALKKKRGVK